MQAMRCFKALYDVCKQVILSSALETRDTGMRLVNLRGDLVVKPQKLSYSTWNEQL
jgi:hypothetical protein